MDHIERYGPYHHKYTFDYSDDLQMHQKIFLSKLIVIFCMLFTTFFIISDLTESGVSTKSVYLTALLAAPAITAFIEFLARKKQGADFKK